MTPTEVAGADLNGDGQVNAKDLLRFLLDWQKATSP
jgi:hypothetical protein